MYFGGSIGWYMVDRWLDALAQKRLSIQVHLISTDSPENITHRVSSSQTEFVLGTELSNTFIDTEDMLRYLYPIVKKAMPFVSTYTAFVMMMKNHQRFSARAKSILKIKPNPTDPNVSVELRIPLGCKADFNLVGQEEDPMFFGVKKTITPTGEIVLFYELKEQRSESFYVANKGIRSGVEMMNCVPEELSFSSPIPERSTRANKVAHNAPSAYDWQIRNVREPSVMSGVDYEDESYYSSEEGRDDDDAKLDEELRLVEEQMQPGLYNAARADHLEVETVYTYETESSRKPSPTKKHKASASVSSAKSSKSTKSSKTAKSTKSTKTAVSTISTRSKRKAGPKTTGLDDAELEVSL